MLRESCLNPRLLVLYARFPEAQGLGVAYSGVRLVREGYIKSRQSEVSNRGFKARVDETQLTSEHICPNGNNS